MTYTVHGMATSGNCHKVRMALDVLGLPYRWNEVDLMGGATRQPQFLAMNPNGKVPVLETADGRYLPESNAILWFLGEGTPLVPDDRFERARALQWMFFEQYSHEPYIAVARFVRRFLEKPADDARMPELKRRGDAALGVMDRHLQANDWFAGDRLSIADLALFAYTHRAADGDFDLAPYPSVRAWLARVAAAPGVTEMPSP
jgi:glutathione S-transferase